MASRWRINIIPGFPVDWGDTYTISVSKDDGTTWYEYAEEYAVRDEANAAAVRLIALDNQHTI